MRLIFVFLFATFVYVQAQNLTRHDNALWAIRKLPPPEKKNGRAVPPSWGSIIQKVDHFNFFDWRLFSMRYLVNDQFYQSGGPIFILIGGEWEISPDWLQGGNMFDIASQNNAIMYYVEHRFYGRSMPTFTLSTSNLRYLNVKQALADLACFITALKRNSKFANSKVVVFGASYSAMLATWMRYKYPNLVHAAVSSSAPLQAQVDFKEYLEVVQTALNNKSCTNVIKNGVAEINSYLSSGNAGVLKVQKDYKLCSPISVNNFYDKAYFYSNIAGAFSELVQFSTASVLYKVCYDLMDMSLPSDYDRLANFFSDLTDDCWGNYKDFVNYYTSPFVTGATRPWLYQTCNEFGFFQSSSSVNEPFYNYLPVSLNYQMCNDLYGYGFGANRVTVGVEQTNNEYRGKNIYVTRVISVQGTNDPWSVLGLNRSPNPDAPVIIVPGASHCQDMFSISPSDSVALRNAKLKEQEYVKKWLS